MNHQIDLGSDALNEAGWVLLEEIQKYQVIDGHLFNNLKGCLKAAIEKYIEYKPYGLKE